MGAKLGGFGRVLLRINGLRAQRDPEMEVVAEIWWGSIGQSANIWGGTLLALVGRQGAVLS